MTEGSRLWCLPAALPSLRSRHIQKPSRSSPALRAVMASPPSKRRGSGEPAFPPPALWLAARQQRRRHGGKAPTRGEGSAAWRLWGGGGRCGERKRALCLGHRCPALVKSHTSAAVLHIEYHLYATLLNVIFVWRSLVLASEVKCQCPLEESPRFILPVPFQCYATNF